jgi:hypothetical protein
MRYAALAPLTVVALLLTAASLRAQKQTRTGVGRFIIGVDQVGGSMQFPHSNFGPGVGKWLEWVSDAQLPAPPLTGHRPPAAAPSDSVVPLERWEQLRALGIDLAFLHVKSGALRSTGGMDRLRRAAQSAGVALGIADRDLPQGLLEVSSAERRYYHLESHWTELWEGNSKEVSRVPEYDGRFTSWVGAFPLDRPPRELSRAVNCLPMHRGQNAQCTFARRDGSTGRDPADVEDQDQVFVNTASNNSGRYFVSVRLAATIDAATMLSSPDTPLLRVSLIDDDQRGRTEWTVRLKDLLDAQGRLQTAPCEIVLGAVIFRDAGRESDGCTRVTVEEADPWSAPDAVWNSGMNARTDLGLPENRRKLGVNILCVAPPDSAPTLAVDAVILSSALGFALFQPDHERVLPALRGARARIAARIDSLCGVRGTIGAAPVRMLMAYESAQGDGNAATIALLGTIIDSVSHGTATLYMYTNGGGYNKYQSMARAYSGALSGFYWYPFVSVRREGGQNYAIPGDPAYYDQQYGLHAAAARAPDNLETMCTSFHRMAVERRSAEWASDWIPAIQNHTWVFTSGAPNGYPVGDETWLREPTAAENRLLVNLALAYGARGVMYYCYQSTPGRGPWNAPGSEPGIVGLLDPDQQPRRTDRYGESKWDSLAQFHRAYLREMGDLLFPLAWVDGCSVEHGLTSEALRRNITSVRAEQRSGTTTVDAPDETLVECSVFRPAAGDSSTVYIFVVNKRVDARGWRHLRIRFAPGTARQVRDLRSGAAWGLDASGGEIEMCLGPGEATLLRLE